jgi:hypothetical protein
MRRRWRRDTGIVLAGLSLAAAACYSQVPLEGAVPTTGATVVVELTDLGRVNLSGRIGEEVDLVEGAVVSASAADMVVAVQRVTSLRGVDTRWSGEEVRMQPADYRRASVKTQSKGKTALLAGSAAAAALAVVLTKSLIGGGSAKSDSTNGGTNPESTLPPAF